MSLDTLDTLITQVSSENTPYMVVQFATNRGASRSPQLKHVIMPRASKMGTGLLVSTPWHIHLRSENLGDQSDIELAIEMRGDLVFGVHLNAGDNVDIDLNLWKGHLMGVSRRHLLLRPTDGGIYAVDLDSSNGSLLNGSPMSPKQAYQLNQGDMMALGFLRMSIVRIARAGKSTPVLATNGAPEFIFPNEETPTDRLWANG